MEWYRLTMIPVVLGVILVSFFLVFYGSQFFPTHSGEAQLQHKAIMKYLSLPFYEPTGKIAFLTDNEKSHMHDVKAWFDIAAGLLVACAITVGYMIKRLNEFHRQTIGKRSSYYIFGVGGVLLLLGIIAGFGKAWEWFHLVFFPSGNWQFPADSILITLYPLQYFMYMSVAILLLVLGVGTSLYVTIDVEDFVDEMDEEERMND